MKTLLINGHPKPQESVANSEVIKALMASGKITTLHTLADVYTANSLTREQITKEQNLLVEHDNIIFQFPFFWYSVPAILKVWFDDVLEYGFAFGSTGNKLHGKNVIFSFTIGGPYDSYQHTGYNTFTIDELIAPLRQLAKLTGMTYIQPVYEHRMVHLTGIGTNLEVVKEKANLQAQTVSTRLSSIQAKINSF